MKLFSQACYIRRAKLVNAFLLDENVVGTLVGQTTFAQRFFIFVEQNFVQRALCDKLGFKVMSGIPLADETLLYVVWKGVIFVVI